MPSSYELIQNPIIGFHEGERIDFTAFGTPYSQSLIKKISSSGTVELEHTDGTDDVFSVQDMKLTYTLDPSLQAALAPPSNPAGSPGTAVEQRAILFTINMPGVDVHQSTNGGLVASQRSGHYVGAVWVEDPANSAIGGFGYGPASPNQPPISPPTSGGVVNIPPVYYPASQTPPTESVSSGVANFPAYPSQPAYPGYPSQPSYPSQPGYPSQPVYTNPYPSYGGPGYGSAAPATVIYNASGSPINIFVRAKPVVEAVSTTNFIQ